MKALLLVFIAAIIGLSGGAQNFDSATLSSLTPSVRTQVDAHLAKAKKEQKHATALLITGASLQVGSLVAVLIWGETAAYVGVPIFITGSVLALTSIIGFQRAKKERSNARVLIYNDKHAFLTPGKAVPNSQSYGVRLTIPLGK